ncbi:L-threonylcarbamoyladenylate synthase [Candidatus Nitrospira allomarina]|uniref:L-threonylcarbamoyladenylate synthase n=1 Tax=Candidatus Nitrospira allomarina TaxID=3020900 RepID=A0AA96GD04_9BACT|nr:L-threonylcarbamoyladenylate synthase [Candidatus Nitrospira allomarina]WNM59844.1 L-threonylcarbamoyladenylate synthase [Candidatus Nitrospira allomarina]
MATVLPLNSPPSPQLIHQVAQCLQDGGVLAVPTDSFYALSVSPFNEMALKRLMDIKGERSHKPFPVLVGDLSQLNQLTEAIPDVARTLMEEFWPGLLTLVFQARSTLSPILTGGQGTVGIRQPNDPRVCELMTHIGPLTGTSSNRSGQPPAQSAGHVRQQLGTVVDVIVDGGPAPGGQPSTVLQLEPELCILRDGAVTRKQIEVVLGQPSLWFRE